MKKNTAVEVSKALGMILVVVGHSAPPWFLEKAIYSFHMPFFFCLSGYLYSQKPFPEIFWAKTKGLIIPYFIAAVCSLVIYNLNYYISQGKLPFMTEQIFGIVMADRQRHLQFNGPLWFLPSLFCVFVVNSIFEKVVINRLKRIVLVSLLSILFSFSIFEKYHGLFPLGLDTSVVSIIFFYLGSILRVYKDNLESYSLLLMISSLFIWCLSRIIFGNEYFVIAYGKVSPLFHFYICGITGSIFLFYFSGLITQLFQKYSCYKLIKKSMNLLLLIGSWSFGIYLFHKPLSNIFFKQIIQSFEINDPIGLWVFCAFTGILYPIMIISIIKPFFPKTVNILLGGRII